MKLGLKLEAVLSVIVLDSLAIATICVDLAGVVGIPRRKIKNYSRSISAFGLEKQLQARRSFLLEGDGLRAHLAWITDLQFAYLTVIGVPASALDACAELLDKAASIVSTRWVDAEYDHWQNAEDPLLFKVAGLSMSGLPMKSNGLPPPLEQLIIDTSRNPGRRVLRDGYVEAVGHKMWLGREYFTRVPGADRHAIQGAEWLRVTELEGGLLEIVASDEPFTDDTTADIQNRLRRLLFPTTA